MALETNTASSDMNISEDVLLGNSANSETLSNDDAVSLFISSLRKALQKQNEIKMSLILK